MIRHLYTTFFALLHPALPLFLRLRERQGKEDPLRRSERLGISAEPRPAGRLIWLHAASMGEAASVMPLLHRLHAEFPGTILLLTTVTVTSAQYAAERLPRGALHQFAPVDTPQAVDAFLTHWRPDLAVFVESELWPNMLFSTHEREIPMLLLNARLSARSFARWQKMGGVIRTMLACFDTIHAQSEADADRLEQLAARKVLRLGNLKYAAPPLEADAAEVERLRTAIGARPCWLAASTHPGEEGAASAVHQALKETFPDLLTIIVPRHSKRGEEIVALLSGKGTVARRSAHEALTPATEFYVADTMGELGIFYRLAPVVFVGGSLVPHGGQNPFEPARLGCAVIYGPHMENFNEFCAVLETHGAAVAVSTAEALQEAVAALLGNPARMAILGQAAAEAVEEPGEVLEKILALLRSMLQRKGA